MTTERRHTYSYSKIIIPLLMRVAALSKPNRFFFSFLFCFVLFCTYSMGTRAVNNTAYTQTRCEYIIYHVNVWHRVRNLFASPDAYTAIEHDSSLIAFFIFIFMLVYVASDDDLALHSCVHCVHIIFVSFSVYKNKKKTKNIIVI